MKNGHMFDHQLSLADVQRPNRRSHFRNFPQHEGIKCGCCGETIIIEPYKAPKCKNKCQEKQICDSCGRHACHCRCVPS